MLQCQNCMTPARIFRETFKYTDVKLQFKT